MKYFTETTMRLLHAILADVEDVENIELVASANKEWGIGSDVLSPKGEERLEEVFLERLEEVYGRTMEVCGETHNTRTVFSRLHGEDEIRRMVQAEFAQGTLTLAGADSWASIMDKWGEVQNIARELNDNNSEFTIEDLADAMREVVEALDKYYGWDL